MVRSISTFLIISDLSSNLDKGALSFEIEGQASGLKAVSRRLKTLEISPEYKIS